MAIAMFVFVAVSLNPQEAEALGYSVIIEFDIAFGEESSAAVNQKVTITNNSEEFLSSSLSLDFPFKNVDSLQVESGGELLPANIESGRLWVEFTDNALDFGEQRTLNIKYQVPAFVEEFGTVRSFLWPKFMIENEETTYPVRINYPIQWEDILYSSQGVDINYAFETRRAIAFNSVNKPLRVYVGNYSLKQLDISIDENAGGLGKQDLFIPLKDGFHFVGDQDSTTVETVNGQMQAKVNLKEYYRSRGMMVMARSGNIFPDSQASGSYYKGVETFPGIDTDNPVKLYQILLSRLNPSRSILEWSRGSVTEILNKTSHTDLDYANTFTAVFRSKNIPAHVVYGIARYPDGKFYWHFWNVYQEREGQNMVWKEVDPYLEDLTGAQYFQNVPPVRIIWGVLGAESDLSDLNTDLFYIKPENFELKYFSSSSAQTGYITSQLNTKTVASTTDSVLGAESSRLSEQSIGYNGSAAVSILAGFVLISFARYFYTAEVNYKVKRKVK